jgi:hypothetical protein
MSTGFHKKWPMNERGWTHRCVALVLLGVLIAGFWGSIWHNVATEHVFCDEHAQVEHRDTHVADSPVQHLHTEPQHAPGEDNDAPDHHDGSCELHFWLASSSVPMPDVHASLLNLPPPAAGLEVAATPLTVGTYTPIDILHVSPGLSPPSGLV